MSRKLTTYKNPSIAEQLSACETILQLATWRVRLQEAYQSGALQPARKTVLEWQQRLWERVFFLVATAATPGDACFIYNVTLRWQKPAGMQEALWHVLSTRVAQLPDDVERFARQGVTIEGISTPAQRKMAEAFVPTVKFNDLEIGPAVVRMNLRDEAESRQPIPRPLTSRILIADAPRLSAEGLAELQGKLIQREAQRVDLRTETRI